MCRNTYRDVFGDLRGSSIFVVELLALFIRDLIKVGVVRVGVGVRVRVRKRKRRGLVEI